MNTTTGPDELFSLFLYNCRFILIPITYHSFSLSLKQDYFPLKLKTTHIKHICKKGNKSSVTNYRTISIISVIPKMFSKIIHSKLTPFFFQYP